LHASHDGAPERAREDAHTLDALEALRDLEGVDTDEGVGDRRHDAETKEASVAENEGSAHLAIQLDLDVPQRLLGETRSR
jgi:hypothetical protein